MVNEIWILLESGKSRNSTLETCQMHYTWTPERISAPITVHTFWPKNSSHFPLQWCFITTVLMCQQCSRLLMRQFLGNSSSVSRGEVQYNLSGIAVVTQPRDVHIQCVRNSSSDSVAGSTYIQFVRNSGSKVMIHGPHLHSSSDVMIRFVQRHALVRYFFGQNWICSLDEIMWGEGGVEYLQQPPLGQSDPFPDEYSWADATQSSYRSCTVADLSLASAELEILSKAESACHNWSEHKRTVRSERNCNRLP